jgi:hypothetical protein
LDSLLAIVAGALLISGLLTFDSLADPEANGWTHAKKTFANISNEQ